MKSPVWFGLVLMALLPATVMAESNEDIYNTLDRAKKVQLAKLKVQAEYLDLLQKKKLLTTSQVKAEKNGIMLQAQKVLDKKLQDQAAIGMFNLAKEQFLRTDDTAWEIFASKVTLVNIFLFLGAIVFVIGIVLILLFMDIPGIMYEVFFYFASLCVFFFARYYVSAAMSPWIALLGCAGLTGALVYSFILHSFKFSLKWFFGISCLLWMLPAVLFDSPVLGFVAVVPLGIYIGDSFLVKPFNWLLGTEKETLLGGTLGVSFLYVGLYLVVEGLGLSLPRFNIFASGFLYIGSTAFCISELIMASRWYMSYRKPRFFLFQLIAVGAAICLILFGMRLDVSQLQQMGGTFLLLYLLEKYIELFSYNSLGEMGLASAGVGLLMYVGSLIIKAYPAYFLISI